MELFPATLPPMGGGAQSGMAYDAPAGEVVYFDSSGASPSTWEYNGSWHQANTTSGPSLAYDYSMTYDATDGYVLLFDETFHLPGTSETWSFRNGSWTKLSPSTAPSPRYGAAMTYDSAAGCVLLFGGLASNATSSSYLNDTWTFANGAWTNVTSVVAPPAREYAQLGDDPPDRSAVLFGGWPDDNQTWDFANGKWSLLSEAQQPPLVNRAGFQYDPAFGGVLLFGGSLVAGAGSSNESWAFKNNSWIALRPMLKPAADYYVTMAYDPLLYRIVYYSGYSQHLWVFGAGVVTIVLTPSRDGTIEVDAASSESYSAMATIELGFGNHSLVETPEPWAVFAAWNSTGNASIWGGHPPSSRNTTVLGNGTIMVSYTPHPRLTFLTDPSDCDGILLNGIGYASGSSFAMFEGNYSAVAPQCPRPPTYLVFTHWSSAGNLSIAAPAGANSTVSLSGNATLIAHYVAQISLVATPASDGSIQLNSTSYPGTSSIGLPVGNYSLVATTQPWAEFVRWGTGGGLAVHGALLDVGSTGVLTAIFRFAARIGVGVSPGSCGNVSVNGTGVPTGGVNQVPIGTYSLRAPNCTASSEVFGNWVTTGGLAVGSNRQSATTLTVVGNGTLAADFVPGYSVQFLVEGGDGGTLLLNGTVEPSGSRVLLAAGEYPVSAVAGGSGYVLKGWQTSGKVQVAGARLQVTGAGAVLAVFGLPNSTEGTGSTPEQWVVYALVPGALLAGSVVVVWLARRRRSERERGIEKVA